MFNRKRDKFIPTQETEVVENIFAIIPPRVTIIGEATEDEMERAAELEIRHTAFMRMQEMAIQLDGISYKELLKDFIDFERDSTQFWRGVSRRLSIPYEWPIRIDHALGPVYIGEYDVFEGKKKIDRLKNAPGKHRGFYCRLLNFFKSM